MSQQHGDAAAAGQPQSVPVNMYEAEQALVDEVVFTSRPTTGTVVHLEKALEWDDGAMTDSNPVANASRR